MVPNPLQGNGSEGKAARLLDVHQRLLAAYGPQGWWPGGAGPFEVCVGAILTQSAAWTNVEMALARMRAAEVLSLDGLQDRKSVV